MKKYICFNNEKYSFDIDKIIKYCLEEEETAKENEINEGYEISDNGNVQLTSKIIRELKVTPNGRTNTIKYDLLNNFINVLLDYDEIKTDGEIPSGVAIVLNTLIENGFIKEI